MMFNLSWGEMIYFDGRAYFFRWVVKNHQRNVSETCTSSEKLTGKTHPKKGPLQKDTSSSNHHFLRGYIELQGWMDIYIYGMWKIQVDLWKTFGEVQHVQSDTLFLCLGNMKYMGGSLCRSVSIAKLQGFLGPLFRSEWNKWSTPRKVNGWKPENFSFGKRKTSSSKPIMFICSLINLRGCTYGCFQR